MGCCQGEECLELSLGLPASLRLGLPGLQVLTEQLQEWQEPLPEQPEQGRARAQRPARVPVRPQVLRLQRR